MRVHEGKIVLFVIGLVSLCAAQASTTLGPCDPLVSINCMLPFPNNFYTQADSSTETGLRLRVSNYTFPISKDGESINGTEWNQLDGFSPLPAIMSYFEDLSLDNVPAHQNIAASLDANCPTILLDTETLELLPHWGELDETTAVTTERAFMMWPTKRLEGGRRYIVAMRNLVSSTTGLPIEPSASFLSLRDNTTATDPSIYLRRDHFNDEIFPLLESVGIARDSLQLAWDFTVGSTKSITGRLIHMRDDGLARLPGGSPTYYVTKVDENPSQYIARSIRGEMEVPYYTEHPGPNTHLVLGPDGLPQFQGFTNASFIVNIPVSLAAEGKSGITLQYGHGLFGSMTEINSGYLEEIANDYGYVVCATNWWGMDSFDVPAVTLMMLKNVTNTGIIPDRSQQGMLNFMVLSRLMTGTFASDPNVIFNGVSVVNPNLIKYNGNSQGGIYGCTFMSVSQDITQGVLGVPGGPYVMMLPRSVDFDPYFAILKARYPNAIDRINLLNVIQLLWDRSDPAGYFAFTTSNTLPDTPAKQIIMQYSLGDSQVTWLSALAMGRSMNAYMFPDNVQEDGETLFGFEIATGDVTTAVIQGYNYGAPPVPQTNTPPVKDTDTHACTRRDPRGVEQMYTLFTTGIIKNYCDGPCTQPTDPIDRSECHQSYYY